MATQYGEGSEVEVQGNVYLCNPYPFEIYCTLDSFRPQSTDGTAWNDVWKHVGSCGSDEETNYPSKVPSHQPTSMLSSAPSSYPSERPSNNPTQSPSKQPSTSPSRQPSTYPSWQPSKSPSDAPTTFSPTLSPTTPSDLPSSAMMNVQAEIQIVLIPLLSRLRGDGIQLFATTCNSFLQNQFANATTQIFDIACMIVGQQTVLGERRRRRLGASESGDEKLRNLNDSSALILSVEVNGVMFAADSMDNAEFDNLVSDTFINNHEDFINTLRYDGEDAQIDDFENVNEINVYIEEEEDATTVSASLTETDETPAGKGGALLWTIVGGGLVMILAGLIHRSRRSQHVVRTQWSDAFEDNSDEESSVVTESADDEDRYATENENKGGGAAPVNNGHQNKSQGTRTWPENENQGVNGELDTLRGQLPSVPPMAIFAEAMEDYQSVDAPNQKQAPGPIVEPLPPTLFTHGVRSRSKEWASRADTMSMQCIGESKANRSGRSTRPRGPFRVKRNVIAPPGKLGIIIKQSLKGCMIHGVKSGSPTEGRLFGEDLIVALNDEDVTGHTAQQLTLLIAKNIDIDKKFTVLSLKHGPAPFYVQSSAVRR